MVVGTQLVLARAMTKTDVGVLFVLLIIMHRSECDNEKSLVELRSAAGCCLVKYLAFVFFVSLRLFEGGLFCVLVHVYVLCACGGFGSEKNKTNNKH